MRHSFESVKINRWLFAAGWCVVASTYARAQAFYEAMPVRLMYAPTQGDDLQIFSLNPAACQTVTNKASGYALRHQRSSSFKAVDDLRTETKTDMTEEGYGAGVLTDLGAGLAVGVSAERWFSRADLTVSSVTRVPYETMSQQTIAGRMLIDLAPGLRAGLVLRWLTQRADILGSVNSDVVNDRIQYTGNLIGHGGGVSFTYDKVRVGAFYIPAARGKSEILFEQRIITEPGVAGFDLQYQQDKNSFAVGIERALHRRDERATSVAVNNGNRTVTLDGISPDKNVFLVSTYHAAGDVFINPKWGVRAALAWRQKAWVFDNNALPNQTSGDRMNHLEARAGVLMAVPFELVAGYQLANFKSTLTTQSGNNRNGANYEGRNSAMYLLGGMKF